MNKKKKINMYCKQTGLCGCTECKNVQISLCRTWNEKAIIKSHVVSQCCAKAAQLLLL